MPEPQPIDEVTIRVPDEFVGAVMSDLSGRRGRVLGNEPDPAGHERTLVRVGASPNGLM